MSYSEKAKELRRCKALKANGEPCQGWAMWNDPEGRCLAHAGRKRNFGGGWKAPVKTKAVSCTCAAYRWPHRPSGGLCRWPDQPEYQLLTPAGTHSWPRVRGYEGQLIRQLRRVWRRRKTAGANSAPGKST